MSAGPGPHESPEAWNSADIGPYHWPPTDQRGGVLIAVTTAIDVDTQKPKGKDPAKSTTKGRKVASLKFDFSFTRLDWARGNEIRLALDPHGVNSGKAWELTAREPNDRGVDHVIFKSASALAITGDLYKFSLDADGWSEPKPAQVGGASTPKAAVPNLHIPGGNSNIQFGPDEPAGGTQLPLGEIQPTGLDGPKKPSAEP